MDFRKCSDFRLVCRANHGTGFVWRRLEHSLFHFKPETGTHETEVMFFLRFNLTYLRQQ